MTRMNAKYAGRCRCGGTVTPGTAIDFERGSGVVGCPSCNYTGTGTGSPAVVLTPADLRAALAALNGKLTPEQAAVAAWRPGAQNLRVVAAAGSGKTTTTVALVGNLLAAGVPASKLVVTTFTNKAAGELHERLSRVVTPGDLAAMNVGTFHRLAGLALRHTGRFPQDRNMDGSTGRAKDVLGASLCWMNACGDDGITSLGGVKGVGVGSDKAGDYALAVEAVCRSKGMTLGSADALAACEATGLPHLHAAWSLYEQQKRAMKAWDFADLLAAYHVASLSMSGQVVIVDEAQDNSTLQIGIALELSKRGGNVVLVGDVRQSIYEWRGAAPDLFLNADKVAGAATLFLTANYRSGAAIVALGNAVAAGRSWSLGPDARAARGEQGTVLVTGYADPSDEAAQVAADIVVALRDGVKLSDVAVLCRTRAQQGLFEANLLAEQVPVAIVGGTSYFGSREWRDYAALLAVVYGDAAPADVERAVKGTPGCGYWSARTAVGALARTGDVVDALTAAADDARTAKVHDALAGLVTFVKATRTLPWKAGCVAVAERLAAAASKGNADDDAGASFDAAAGIAGRFEGVAAVRDFAARCEGAVVVVGNDAAAPADRVCISTIHKAKGREWGLVYCSATSGVFPHVRSETDDRRMEEEARLFYVAVTRAARDLRLSYCATYSRTQGGPSTFLDFVPGHDGTDPEGGKAPTAPETAPAASNAAPAVSEGVAAPASAPAAVSVAVAAPADAPEVFERDAADLRAALAGDVARAEALADAGAQPAPGARFVPVSMRDFEALLGRHGFERDAAASTRARQEALSVALTGETKLVVYTTVPVGAAEVRDVGEDSIKVALIGPKGRPLMKRQPYACRTRGWRSTLLDRLDVALATLGAPCARCGGPTVAREGSSGTFHGCVSYPECKGFAVRKGGLNAPAAR